MKNLRFTEVLGLGICWAGVITIAYLAHDTVIAVIAIISAFYLSKYLILKQDA